MYKPALTVSMLLATTALAALACAPAALAQGAPVVTGAGASQDMLGEVVVTATRQSDTVNRVALSVTAVTQKTIDRSGVRNLQDIARTVPSLTFRRSTSGEGTPTVAIRGIGSSLGAPTTGVYLDDVPLQKRDNPGAANGNGTPFPPLFDLERVEILRGPQGTLYGGSSEGGTVRFITPSPSLTRRSVYARSDVSSTKDGGTSYETGVAVGGPIIEGKLGFRASLFGRHTAGYVDQVSLYDGHTIAKDVNTGNTKVARVAVTWSPIEQLKITPAIYASYDHVSAQDVWWEDVPAYTLNAGTFTNSGTINGVRYDFPNKTFAGGTFGPYNQFGPNKTGAAFYTNTTNGAQKINSPRNTYIMIPSLTLEYDFENMAVKSITSFPSDNNKGYSGGLLGVRTAILPTATNAGFVGPTGAAVVNGVGAAALAVPGQPDSYREFRYGNTRHGLIQELRFSSKGEHRLTWVAGIFFSNANLHQHTMSFDNENQASQILRGIDSSWLLGQTSFPGNNSSEREVRINENELAGFGELNFMITSKLKATAGVRLSRTSVSYEQQSGGPVQGGAGYIGTPGGTVTVTDPNCGFNPLVCQSATFHPFPNQPGDLQWVRFSGSQQESPVSPKFGLSYQANEQNLFYATAAKGYRTGGLNQPVSVQNCLQDLQLLNITSTPLTYSSDSVWSYEGGAKMRLFGGRAQVNSSVFYVDWNNPQLQNRFRCGHVYVVNAGHATSKGFDVQAQGRLGPITLDMSVSRTDAKYTEELSVPTPTGKTIIVAQGDELGSPDWQVSLGAQYDFMVMDRYGAFIRADYQYSGTYQRGVGPTASGYDPITAKGNATRFMTARAGITLQHVDLSLYVNNLTNSQDILARSHGSLSPLITNTSFRPREVGLQAIYRY